MVELDCETDFVAKSADFQALADQILQVALDQKPADLEALRAAVDDPALVPNGIMPITIGSCLVYAIYHSPLAFIRELLEIGADPKAPVDDGFPPLIAALSCGRDVPGAVKRTDVHDILRLLLKFGADPNQRGNNDYTALHMAVAEHDPLAVLLLLDAGADRELRTRIDDYETPLEMARTAGLPEIAAPTPAKLLSSAVTLAGVPPGRRKVR